MTIELYAAHIFALVFVAIFCAAVKPLQPATGLVIIAFIFTYAFTPSVETMCLNRYRDTIKARPTCIDEKNPDLDCKTDYINWRADSLKSIAELNELAEQINLIANDIRHDSTATLDITNNQDDFEEIK